MKYAILLITAFVVMAKPIWPVVDYLVNYDYIVETLCENKDRPEMNCNGKCHLSKELAKEAGNDDKNPLSGKTSKSEIPQIIISEHVSEFLFLSGSEPATTEEIGYKSVFYTSLFSSKILHPPRLG